MSEGEAPRAGSAPAPIAFADVVAALGRPAAFGLPEEAAIEQVESHVSVVCLTPRRAYKLKKPVRFWGLLDQERFEDRKRLCEEEVRLNRRLAPEIYLGVVPIIRSEGGEILVHRDQPEAPPEGSVVEHAVEMVRLVENAGWEARAQAGALSPEVVEDLAVRLAEFHREHRLSPEIHEGLRPQGLARIVRRNVRATSRYVGTLWSARLHQGFITRIARRLQAVRGLLRRRIGEGLYCDGHGDLRLAHVARHQGRVVVIDCVEFSTRLRHIDPLSDVAFLSMDLILHGRPDLADHLERAWRRESEDRGSSALLPLYRAYRAHVRAMVSATTASMEEILPETRETGQRSSTRAFTVAWTQSRLGAPPPILLLHGLAGSGKSVLGARLAPWLNARHLRSDLLRKRLSGLEPLQRPTPEQAERLYSREVSALTYATLLDEARKSVKAGMAAILDATFLLRKSRDEARALARSLGTPFVLVEVTCPEPEIRRRLEARAARGDDESDAGVAVYEAQKKELQALTDAERRVARSHSTVESLEPFLLELLEQLETQTDPAGEALGTAPLVFHEAPPEEE